jgi:cobalt-precorrin-5B (C1)-methyltransferase
VNIQDFGVVNMARTGYTIPVFAVAAAKAALLHLQQESPELVAIELLPDRANIPIQQVSGLAKNQALAICLSDPGDNLDLTRDMPIWAKVELVDRGDKALVLCGGEGLGRDSDGNPAIYDYAKKLFDANLLGLIPDTQTAIVTIILPEGRQLAQRTSNAAFGIFEGLSLLGTSGISQPLSAEAHLDDLRQILQQKAAQSSSLVFCIGSSGMQVAAKLGIADRVVVQTGNWIGAMLVEAGLCGVRSALLLGYQGKLIKLAGGIFNTSSHLADAKLEIITATAIRLGYPIELAQLILQSSTADAAYKALVDKKHADVIFTDLAQQVSNKASRYVQKYANVSLSVTTALTDRQGQIIATTGDLSPWQSSSPANVAAAAKPPSPSPS